MEFPHAGSGPIHDRCWVRGAPPVGVARPSLTSAGPERSVRASFRTTARALAHAES
jgi:hypothetical protein